MATQGPLVRLLRGEKMARPPIWIMRQAGRYLPEYRQVRQSVGGFLDLCFDPVKAAEVTLQPLKRFDLDAAIIFSDILTIPFGLGQKVWFETGEGPRLAPLEVQGTALDPNGVPERLAPVYEALERVRADLPADKALIGFCGAPWTVASYMIAGQGSPDQAKARIFAETRSADMAELRSLLVEVSARHLAAQVRAGADLVQIFESWGANLDEDQFAREVIAPNRALVARFRELAGRDVPVIGFPRGSGVLLERYAREVGVDAVGIDQMQPLSFVNRAVPDTLAVQGSLDPLRLVAGGPAMKDRVTRIIEGFAHRRHVFNLGHGIVPQTPIEHVAALVEQVREG